MCRSESKHKRSGIQRAEGCAVAELPSPHQCQLVAPGTSHQHLMAVVVEVLAKEPNKEITVCLHVRHRLPPDLLMPLWGIIQLMGYGSELQATTRTGAFSSKEAPPPPPLA